MQEIYVCKQKEHALNKKIILTKNINAAKLLRSSKQQESKRVYQAKKCIKTDFSTGIFDDEWQISLDYMKLMRGIERELESFI